MGRNTPKEWKNGIFVPFFLCLYLVLSSLLAEIDVKVVQMSIGFELWFVDGRFIADEYFFVMNVFMRGIRKGGEVDWFDLIGWGDGWVLAEGVLTRACMRALVLGVLFFCCHKCHIILITHYLITIYTDNRNNIPHCHTFTLLLHPKKSPKHHPQNNFSTSNLKQPVTFHKTTRCFL